MMQLFGGYGPDGLLGAPAALVERMELVRLGTLEAEQTRQAEAEAKYQRQAERYE